MTGALCPGHDVHAAVRPVLTVFARSVPLSAGLKVGYQDDGGVWPFLAPSLVARLPLRAIEWRNLVGVTKCIDSLQLNFVSETDGDSGAIEEEDDARPLVGLYIVNCEDSDRYRSVVKPKLTRWVDRMIVSRREWMVLYVPLGTRARAGSARNSVNPVYKKIFDKIKSDLSGKKPLAPVMSASAAAASASAASAAALGNSAVSERVWKIEALEGMSVVGQQQLHQSQSQWSELLLALRHCIMDAFQMRCFQYEEEVRVLDAKVCYLDWPIVWIAD